MSSAGYSGTPLARKLGYQPGMRVCWVNAPDNYAELLGELPEGVLRTDKPGAELDLVHIFVSERLELGRQLAAFKQSIFPDGTIWISWPKRSALKQHGLSSDITEETIRELCLPLGLVDNKVCAVDEIWSGLKLVWRKELRKGPKGQAAPL